MSTKTYDVLYAEYSEGAQLSLDLDSFLSIGKKLLDEFGMVTYIDRNIREYGLDDLSNEIIQTQLGISVGKEELLPAVEGFIDGLINAIKSFFKKIGELFSKFFRWIGSLFSGNTKKYEQAKSVKLDESPAAKVEIAKTFTEKTEDIQVLPWMDMRAILSCMNDYLSKLKLDDLTSDLSSDKNSDDWVSNKKNVQTYYFTELPRESDKLLGIHKEGSDKIKFSEPDSFDHLAPMSTVGFSFDELRNTRKYMEVEQLAMTAAKRVDAIVDKVKSIENTLLGLVQKNKEEKTVNKKVNIGLKRVHGLTEILHHLLKVIAKITSMQTKIISQFSNHVNKSAKK